MGILWCTVGVMFYMKPKSYQDANPDEQLVARVSMATACGGICCTISCLLFLIVLAVMAPTEGGACPADADECGMKQQTVDEMETCECWNGTYTGRRRGGSYAEKQQQEEQNNSPRRR